MFIIYYCYCDCEMSSSNKGIVPLLAILCPISVMLDIHSYSFTSIPLATNAYTNGKVDTLINIFIWEMF